MVPSETHNDVALTDASTLAKGSSLSLFGSVAGALVNMGLVFVITRGLGADDGGAFFEAIALFNIAVVAVAIGADTGLLRFTASSLALEDTSGQGRLLAVGLVPVLVVSVLVAIVGFQLAPTLGSGFGGEHHADEVERMIRLLAFFLPLGAINLAVLGATRGYGTMLPTVAAERVGRPTVQLVLAALAIGAGASATWLAIGWGTGFQVSLIAAVVWLIRLRRRHEGPSSKTGPTLKKVALEFWAFSLPRALASMFRVGVLWLDVLLVGALMTPRDAAIYTVATRVIQAGYLATDAIGQAVEPMFSSLLAGGHRDRTHKLYQVSTAWLVGLTWPLFLAAWVFAPAILGLFGSDFREAAPVVAILAGSALLGSGFGSIDILLVMAGKSVWSLGNSAAALTTNVVLNLILIPKMGINGAALAWAISRIVSNVLPFLEMRSMLGINPVSRGWRTVTAASLATFGLIGLGLRLTLGTGLGVVAVYVLIAGAAYLTIIWRERQHLELAAFTGMIGKRLGSKTRGGTA